MIANRLSINNIKKITSEVGWIVTGQFANIASALVLVRILTSYMEPAEYGVLALALTAVGFTNIVLIGTASAGAGRFYSIAKEGVNFPAYAMAAQVQIIAICVFILIITCFVDLILWVSGYDSLIKLTTLTAIYALVSGVGSYLSGIQTAARERSIVALHNGLDGWLKVLLIMGVALYSEITVNTVIFCMFLSSLIVVFSQLIFYKKSIGLILKVKKKKIESIASRCWIDRIWQYAWPFAIWGVFGWVQQSSLRWALELYSSRAEVGYFSLLSQIGYTPIQLFAGLSATYLMPIIFSKVGTAKNEEKNRGMHLVIDKILLITFGLTLCGVITAIIFHKVIFTLFTGQEYQGLSPYLPFLVFAGGIFSAAQLVSGRMMAMLQTNRILIASIGSSIIGILAAFIGAFFWGLQGVILSLVIHAITYLLWLLYLER